MFRTIPAFTTRPFLAILALAAASIFLFVSDSGQAVFAALDRPMFIGVAAALALLSQHEPARAGLHHLGRAGLIAVPIGLVILCGPALAQAAETPAPAVSSGFTEILAAVFTAAVTSIVGWIAFLFRKYVGTQAEVSIRAIEMAHRDAIEKAAATAAAMVIQAIGKGMPKSQAFSQAIGYLDRVVPDALQYFGLGSDVLANKIEAKLAEMFGIQPLQPAGAPAPAPTSPGGS